MLLYEQATNQQVEAGEKPIETTKNLSNFWGKQNYSWKAPRKDRIYKQAKGPFHIFALSGQTATSKDYMPNFLASKRKKLIDFNQ